MFCVLRWALYASDMIDSHAHVAFSQFDEDREEIISRARGAGVEGWIEVGTDIGSSKKAIELARSSSLSLGVEGQTGVCRDRTRGRGNNQAWLVSQQCSSGERR